MEGKEKRSLPLNLPLPRKEDVVGSPRLQEPSSSHRYSVASTGIGDPSSPYLRSPALTHISSALPSPKAAALGTTVLPPPFTSPRQLPQKDVLRHGVLISPGEEAPRGTIMTPAIIRAKAQGKSLPPIKEDHISMLDEFVSPHTASLIDEIPKENMLRMAGPSMFPYDARFTEDVKQYQLDHPIPPSMLKKYPNYGKFPLLLNQIHRPTLEPNVKDVKDFEHLRGHNEAMLENKWEEEKERKDRGLSMREAYMYVPNFGRVQVLLTDFSDETARASPSPRGSAMQECT
ncbi:hypothetical protein, conserved [Eimeria maxima]|uniref:Uncharacterized protein n=1 Tax=Eimeria maxima TaxID=5804 RepID=U6MEZ8_EIMMA|nr:hypothetical protein, conserved [Eimeria maxima]CDJ61623.1 hypothetical protein, conserved [Eimeria maxima]